MAIDVGSLEWNAQVDLSALRSDLEEVQQKLEETAQAAEEVGNEIDSQLNTSSLNTSGLQDIQTESQEASGELNETEGEAKGLDSVLSSIDMPDLSGSGLGDFGDSIGDVVGDVGGLSGAAKTAGTAISGLGSTASLVVGSIVAIGAAAATAAIKFGQFAAEASELGQQLEVASAQSGVAAEEIQDVYLVAQQLNSQIDLDSIRDAFKELALRTEEAQQDGGEARKGFRQLGISMNELAEMNTAETFRRVRNEMQDLTPAQRALTAEQIAGGEAGEKLAQVFALTEEEYNQLLNSVEQSSLTGDQIDEMAEMRQEWTQVQQVMDGFVNNFVTNVGPPVVSTIEDMVTEFQDLIDKIDNLPQATGLPDWFLALTVPGFAAADAVSGPNIQQPTMEESEQVEIGGSESDSTSTETDEVGGEEQSTGIDNQTISQFQQVQTELERIDALVSADVIPTTRKWEEKINTVEGALRQVKPNTKEFQRLLDLLNKIQEKAKEAQSPSTPKPPVPDTPVVEPDNTVIEPQDVSFDTSFRQLVEKGLKKKFPRSFRIAKATVNLPGIENSVFKLDKLTKKFKENKQAAALMGRGLRTLSSMGAKAMTQLATSVGKGLGKVIAGTQSMKDLGDNLLKKIASLMQQVASALISIGTAMMLVPGIQGPGAVYLAAGTALMVAASALKASASKGDQGSGGGGGGESQTAVGLASGGVVTGEGLAFLHSQEVVRDKKVDDNMFSKALSANTGGGGELRTRVRGEELEIILDRNKRKGNLAGL